MMQNHQMGLPTLSTREKLMPLKQEYDLLKHQCLVAVGKHNQGLWRPRIECTLNLDAAYLPCDL